MRGSPDIAVAPLIRATSLRHAQAVTVILRALREAPSVSKDDRPRSPAGGLMLKPAGTRSKTAKRRRMPALDILADRRAFCLGQERRDAFMAVLSMPPKSNRRLRNLLARRPAWERSTS
jgi:hypothetical protein